MNKRDLIRFAQSTSGQDVTFADAEGVVNAFLRGIEMCLEADEDVLISGFGKFEVRHKRPVMRRNPQTGEPVEVPAKRGVGFKPSDVVKDHLNRGK